MDHFNDAAQLPEVWEIHRVPAVALRVTLLTPTGVPRHDQTMVWRFSEEDGVTVRLAVLHAQSEVRAFDPSKRWAFDVVDHVDAAVTVVPEAGGASPEVCDLARFWWDATPGRVAVEAWSKAPGGGWWYVLVPWWSSEEPYDADAQALDVAFGEEIWAAASALRGARWTWPAAAPVADPRPRVGPFTWYVAERTAVPPPVATPLWSGGDHGGAAVA